MVKMEKEIKEKLAELIEGTLTALGVAGVKVSLEHPAELAHGDYATNVAMAAAKAAGKNPRALAEEIVAKLKDGNDEALADISVAGPGFINFKLSNTYFANALSESLEVGDAFGKNETLANRKVIVEYTDPNPFKEFHIGHLMSNTIGESISRLVEASGAETKRACYQGDVGLHVAKAIWVLMKQDEQILKDNPDIVPQQLAYNWSDLLKTGKLYAIGNRAYENDDIAKREIIDINKKIYDRTDEALNTRYTEGRDNSLAYFETMYKRLGTTHGDTKAFDFYFFESNTGEFGKKVVGAHPEIFESSEGAVVYKGDEAIGLHTRVFINKEGLPTYEAKELGLAQIKYDAYPYDTSIIITGNEVNDYFRVLLDAMAKVFPELAAKTEHYSHGMLRLPSGKMSSRTGDVITADALLADVKARAIAKITSDNFSDEEKSDIGELVAVGAIKYTILRQASGKDIIFDIEQSLSFEGDSGPYLQYTHARTRSLIKKAGEKKANVQTMTSAEILPLHKYILRFPQVVLRAQQAREPHFVATYLIEIAREFNAFYANNPILDGSPDEPYKLALVESVSRILKSGLWLLGIEAPDRM